jgi:hypothetical protein
MGIKKETEDLIKERADIVSVIGEFFELRKAGVMYECLCPFHNDRHLGSFKINPKKNTYKCYSCGEGGDAIEFLMKYRGMDYPDALRWLAAKFDVWIDEETKQRYRELTPAKPRALVIQASNLPRRTWPAAWVQGYQHTENDDFCRWLRQLPWNRTQRKRLEQVLSDYRVGHMSITDSHREQHEFTAWWEIDQEGTVHNAHLMKYGKDGHRDKESGYTQTWLHARMRYVNAQRFRPFDDNTEQASYCLFGEHLLKYYPEATVRIVESEKTAIIMATAYGNNAQNVWLACCGMQNLNAERLAVLATAHRHIMLLPDRDGIDRWRQKLNDLHYARASLDTAYVTTWWRESDGPKADCADVVVNRLIENSQRKTKDNIIPTIKSQPTALGEIIRRHPVLGPFVDDLQLHPIADNDERTGEQPTTTTAQ